MAAAPSTSIIDKVTGRSIPPLDMRQMANDELPKIDTGKAVATYGPISANGVS